ncbi:ABC transporter ATP-binding protein [Tunicatimonas pelagia]|uniref:ABC transporter ATP-binding protein n=1 Tax=Tunicatimonas pelagia TaxID=931531 RepID=UPI0026652B79|nr:ATP-binding cassette domain-containing protein [Tunicatimonas pelagia]WKN42356.1 ATP-binding cassette domain-containing protein [Tunicatimonas pelagia]
MIQIENVTFQYTPRSTPFQFPDWLVNAGEHAVLLGASGSGKTTLLHLLAGLLRPTQGKIMIGSQNIAQLSGSALDRFRGQKLGLIFQQPHLLNSLTLEQNLLLAQYLAGVKQDRKVIQKTLTSLSLDHRAKARVTTLSQGEAQRAAIARAVLNNPTVILADEPTSSLDDENCNRVLELLRNQAQQHQATLLIVTHDQRVKEHIPHQLTLAKA